MRLIDADALVSALNNGRLKEQTGRALPFNAGVMFALTMVEYVPTIDAVPVVRCKDCKWSIKDDWICGHPNNNAWNISTEHYCGYGERRTNEDR